MRACESRSGSAASTTSHTGTPAARERRGQRATLEARPALGDQDARRAPGAMRLQHGVAHRRALCRHRRDPAAPLGHQLAARLRTDDSRGARSVALGVARGGECGAEIDRGVAAADAGVDHDERARRE